MALNEMDARLISQNEKVASVKGTALVPVATAEGQPQKNIALSDFANSMGNAVERKTNEQVSITGLFAKTTDGKMVELTSSSVASVMNGLMNNISSSGSVNNLVNRGVYYVNVSGGKNTDLPDGVYWGILTVTQTSWNEYRTITQDLQSNDNRHYTRSYYSANGQYPNECTSPWQRIDNFGANTKEELASMVAGLLPFNSRLGQYSGDLNTLHQTAGMGTSTWIITGASTNSPFSGNGGLLLNVSRYNANNTLSVVMQLGISAAADQSDNLLFRSIYKKQGDANDTILQWKKISLT